MSDGPIEEAHSCFYRGGFFNWLSFPISPTIKGLQERFLRFEGGPKSSFLNNESPGYKPIDGDECKAGTYCVNTPELEYWYPCSKENGTAHKYKRGSRED